MDFDSKGIHLASATRSGCLTILRFDNLYCSIYGPNSGWIGEKNCLHICTYYEFDAVRWNPMNEDEVICTSYNLDQILIYDVNCPSPEPIRTLEKGVNSNPRAFGFSDITFSSSGASRLFASGCDGTVYMWDMRLDNLPALRLFTSRRLRQRFNLNSIETGAEDWKIFGAYNFGEVLFWDLRTGTRSSTEVPPADNFDVVNAVDNFAPYLATNRRPSLTDFHKAFDTKEIYSIRRDPSYSEQLAFHLETGGSGVLDIRTKTITQVHCPIFDDTYKKSYCRQRPAWMPGNSVQQ